MMKKNKLLVTDTHLGIKKSSDIYLDVVYNLFVDICKTAQERNIKELYHLGDFFDNRKHLSLKALDYAEKIGHLINDTFENAYFILGNHDLFYKDRYFPTSHQVFTKYDNIHLISEPTIVDDTLLVPWMLDNDKFHPFIDLSQYKTDYCMGHFDIFGAKMGVNNEAKEGRLHFEDFSQFKKVYSGHYHIRGVYGNVEYLGSPYHQSFNDNGLRGYHIFNNGVTEFVEWSGYPEYVQLTARDDVWISNDIKGKIVKLTFLQDYGILKNNEILKSVQDLIPLQLFTAYQFCKGMTDSEREESEDFELKDAQGIHVEFVEKSEVPQHLNKKTIIMMLDKLYKELRG